MIENSITARDPWIALRWRLRRDGLRLDAEDSRGRQTRGEASLRWYRDSLWQENIFRGSLRQVREQLGLTRPGRYLHVPVELEWWVRDLLAELPHMRGGPYGNGPVPLPVFVEAPPGRSSVPVEAWVDMVEAILQGIDPDRFQLLRLPTRHWQSRPLFRLPLRILAIDRIAEDALQPLRNASWYQDPEVRSHGLRLDSLESRPLRHVLRSHAYDIVIVDAQNAPYLLQSLSRFFPRGEHRPRLLIVLEDGTEMPLEERSLPLPVDASLLRVPSDGPWEGSFLEQFLYGIIHDYPLHEAVKAAWRSTSGRLPRQPRLVADPRSNQALRMADSVQQLRNDAEEADRTARHLDVDTALHELGEAAEPIAPFLRSAIVGNEQIRSRINSVQWTEASFERESLGLVPLARAEADLKRAQQDLYHMQGRLVSAVREPAVAKWASDRQERRVDVELHEAASRRAVDAGRPLIPGGEYLLRVRVGRPGRDSLVRGEVPSLDQILERLAPGEDGHSLEVALFEKAFRTGSPRVQRLFLPRIGESDTLEFSVLAPRRRGRRDLRIAIYHRNHMLQSFRLDADIGAVTAPSGARRVEVRLDFSRTESFTNIDDFYPRALTVGLNENRGGHTHSFMMKKDSAAHPLRVTEGRIDSVLKRFRALLEEITFRSDGESRFLPDPPEGAQSEEFQNAMRDLADLGHELFQLLTGTVKGPMLDQLRRLRDQSDETIQIVRFDPNLVFPWGLVYDYPLPRAMKGSEPRRLCMGTPIPELGPAKPSARRKGCPHNPGHDVYCIEGFWGVRHRIEQLLDLGTDHPTNTVNHVVRPRACAGVQVAVGIEDDYGQELQDALQRELGTSVSVTDAADDLLSQLWDPARRPAVLIILGHLETEEKDDEPLTPRILLVPRSRLNGGPVPEDKWLTADAVSELAFDPGRWGEQPHSIVLLMACGTAATDVSTLNNLALSLAPAGPAAVVGTECAVFSGLAERFAREVTLDLWRGTHRLGAAVQAFNRSLLRAGNPLAFAFACYGNADLYLDPEASS